ncbi:MAG: rod shape-determining protein MreC [Rhodothermaceae bacterium]|nr:rod shape-determining protein MreC [Rhodothermaceae bacterium]
MALAASLWERLRAWLVFGVLMVISVVLLARHDGPTLRTARAGSLALTARVEGLFAGVGRFRQAVAENERLRAETIDLSTEVARLREARAENERLRSLLAFGDTLEVPRVPVRIVAKDITQQENLLTIDAGRADSIRVNMPVIDERGIVGKVVLVGENHALVMPHQSTQFAVPATLDVLQQDGIVRWDGLAYDRLLMEYVPKTEPVEQGMLVTTSGYSGIFPAGVPVGIVDSVFAAQGRNDYVIYLRPSAPISRANYVYVLLSAPDPEIDALRTQAEANE